jgi:iron(III) transport system permease protein
LLVAPPRVVLGRITLPQTVPFILVAILWTIVSTTSEMTVTNIYLINPGERTYTEQFYMTLALSADMQAATIAVLPGIIGLATLILLGLWMLARLSSRRMLPVVSQPVTFSSGRWQTVLNALVWLTVFALLGVPIASLVAKAGFVVMHEGTQRIPSWSSAACLREIAAVPHRFAGEFRGSTLAALGAATTAIIAGVMLAWRARRSGSAALPAMAAIVLGLAIPGPLIGAALIQLFNHDVSPNIPSFDGTHKSWLLILYDNTPLAPILAQAIRALPLTTLLLWHSFATLSNDVLDAAALDGLSPRRVFWRIAVPQRWRAMVAAWIAAFAVAAGDLAWAHLVTPPGLDLLSRRVFGLVHSGVEEQVAAISLLNMIAYALLAIVILWLLAPLRLNQPGKSRTIPRPVGQASRLP